MELRHDIFPNADRITLKELFDEYLGFGLDFLEEYFESKENLIRFINNIKSPEEAERFIRLLPAFYHLLKTEDEYSRLVLRLAILESLGQTKYQTTNDWIMSLDKEIFTKIINGKKLDKEKKEAVTIKDFKKIYEKLYRTYNNKYGSMNAIVNILDKNIPDEEKIYIISSFRDRKDKYLDNLKIFSDSNDEVKKILENSKTIDEAISNIHKFIPDDELSFYLDNKASENLFPRCYDYRTCDPRWDYCSVDSCKLVGNEKKLKKELKHRIGLLYKMRSEFVHKAVFNYSDAVGSFGSVLNGKPIIISLPGNKFNDILKKCVYNYFENKRE